MVFLDVSYDELRGLAGADIVEWEQRVNRIFNRADEAADRHHAELVLGVCDDLPIFILRVDRTRRGKIIRSADIVFIEPHLAKKSARFVSIATAFFEGYTWDVEP